MKTVATRASVSRFIDAIDDPERRRDCKALVKLMRRITGEKPVLWGDSMVGFGVFRYGRSSGEKFEYFRTGFSPRKQALTVYILPGYTDFSEILARLGPHKTGKSCLYLKRLADVDPAVLEELVRAGLADMSARFPRD
jgi:hypothetical protein